MPFFKKLNFTLLNDIYIYIIEPRFRRRFGLVDN